MKHFKNLLIKLQTLDIKINQGKASSGKEQEITYYDISHQNPFLSSGFKNEIREVKELAITDVLNIPKEQITFQLQRLEGIKEVFLKFWDKYYHLNVPVGSEHNQELIFQLGLDEIFIAPRLMFSDQAVADDNFIDDLESSIRFRQDTLSEFQESVKTIVKPSKESENIGKVAGEKKQIKAKPSFKEDIIPELYGLLKNYFSEADQAHLINLITSKPYSGKPLVFMGNGNQLADSFKQLFDANLIAGCNKAELENWITHHFVYREKGMQKSYTEKYLQDIISSNTKACMSPLFDVRRNEGRLYIYALTRNNKNTKR